ncbi:TerB family tellurite resistance protein [Rhizosphaericola mali]|uniref:TerB family tellurite resistance protein n=1 Tax=Rhizosphaericola mali TaxID=2545455 RepID=A0A5P2FZA2_9BACT|nr:TerB family tellurite resistance protein [Rhizosphaericola mali]QES88545.1 TerB family tellurite resistance protein [Rhizosphaericola mali]
MKYLLILLTSITAIVLPHYSHGQAQELEMLSLDIEKLSQMKQTLQNMFNAYTTLENGYNKVKSVTLGNYSLHQVFLDGLLAISPTVTNYVRIGDIVSNEAKILSEYKTALAHFKSSSMFSPFELTYASAVYTKIVDGSVSNLDALVMVLTAGQTRMSDNERITEIDRIYKDMEAKLTALRSFSRRANKIIIQRQALQSDHVTQQTILGNH